MQINNTSFSIKLSDDDILSFPHHGPFSLPKIFQAAEFRKLLKKRLYDFFDDFCNDNEILLSAGMNCELLKQSDLSCQTGKLKITVEFVPDIIESLPQIQVSDEVKHEPSPLDAFR
jgi:KGK domain